MPEKDITPTVHEIRQTLKKIRRVQRGLSDEDNATLIGISVVLSKMYDTALEKLAKDATTLKKSMRITPPLK